MSLVVNLEKSAQSLKLNLQKRGVNAPPAADLAFILDVSGSFEREHLDGSTQLLLERLVPWGMVFDPDKKLDVFTFADGAGTAHHVGEITPETCEGYIRREIVGRVPGWKGGTDYSYVLEAAMRTFGWLPSEPAKRSFMSKLIGKKPAEQATKRKSIVLFVTDGENEDQQRTAGVLEASQQRHDDIYFLFIGISRRGSTFPFLEALGKRFANTGLTVIQDMKSFVITSDDKVNDALIGDELLGWLSGSQAAAGARAG